jgi:hypothetical protein
MPHFECGAFNHSATSPALIALADAFGGGVGISMGGAGGQAPFRSGGEEFAKAVGGARGVCAERV